MRSQFFIFSLLLVLFTLTVAGQRSASKDERAVTNANEAYDKAIVNGDGTEYDRIVSDDFRLTNHQGVVTTKADELNKIRNRTIKFLHGKSSDVEVKLYGTAAVVTGRFDARFVDANKKEHSFSERYTAFFIKRRGSWQMVAEHSSEILQLVK